MDAVADFFKTGKLCKQVNATALTLIPKGESPRTIREFRPSVCCNVILKIITKVLATRLSSVLPHIIHSGQGAFVDGRLLNYNVFLSQELLNKYGRVGISPRCAMKVDVQKAYDTLD